MIKVSKRKHTTVGQKKEHSHLRPDESDARNGVQHT